jgi:hypothetical protein
MYATRLDWSNVTPHVCLVSTSTMLCFLIPALYFILAAASFTNCATYSRSLPIYELYTEPPSVVAAHQPMHFRIQFAVPPTTWVPHGYVEIKTRWFGILTTTERSALSDYVQTPLYPGFYTIQDYLVGPTGWGPVTREFNVYNASGSQLLCARWNYFATGTNTNETIWPFDAPASTHERREPESAHSDPSLPSQTEASTSLVLPRLLHLMDSVNGTAHGTRVPQECVVY